MSKAEVERFVSDLKADPTLQATVREKSADPAGIVAIATARGYDFSLEDVEAHLRARKHELSEEELDAASGGVPPHFVVPTLIFIR